MCKELFKNADFYNGYGSTETVSGYIGYKVNREFDNNETLPLGKPMSHARVYLMDEFGDPVSDGETGEIYVKSLSLARGYLNDNEKTRKVFVQNAFNTTYPDILYKTGDLARYNEYGELEYIGRSDSMINHRGHRIELGEIEANAMALEGVDESASIYDVQNERIVLVYSGIISAEEITEMLRKKMPTYMIPTKIINVDKMPHNRGGKIDRDSLKKKYTGQNKND